MILAALLSSVSMGAPASAPDPWTKVPPLPTGCYSSQDHFDADNQAAIEAMKAEIGRQEEINGGLAQKIAGIDGAERAQKMQAFLMSNPQDAMKIMQAMQATGNTVNETTLPREEERQKLEQELTELQSRYNAALVSARAPFDAKFKDLDTRAKKDLVAVGESREYAPWAAAEYDSLISQVNKTYEKICADWWPASGAFPAWLNRYRDFLQEGIPLLEKSDESAKLMYTMMGVPSESFRPTAGRQAVVDYMKHASNVFAQRPTVPELNYAAQAH